MVGKLRALRSWRAAGGSERAEGGPGRPHPGWFIAMEGGDGAGKSTQLAAVADWLRGRGYAVVTTREPGATPLGSVLRNLVLHAEEHKLGARAEALLFAADRADHMETVVRPALERGAVVLTDRHVDSSVAYQSGGRGLAADEVAALSTFATEGVRPDLVVLLDLDPAVARARREERTGEADKLEAETAEFHERVRATFLARAKAEPERYLVLDANQAPRILTGAIQDRLDQLLPPTAEEVATQQERELAERQAAEQERLRQAKERAAASEAAERARAEREWADATRLSEDDKREAERQARERRAEAERDALRRREHELAMRQAEARAKERARLAAAAAKAAAEQSERLKSPTPKSGRLEGSAAEQSERPEGSAPESERLDSPAPQSGEES